MAGSRKTKAWQGFLWPGPLLIICALFLALSASAETLLVRDERGAIKDVSAVLRGDSVLLPGYFGCKHLCHFTMQNLAAKVARFKHHPKMVFLSVDSKETWQDGAMLKKRIKGPEAKFWTFLTADAATIAKLTEKLDFEWKRDPSSETLTHEAALYVMRNAAVAKKISSYDLLESDLNPQTPTGKFFDFKKFCSAFDPSRSKYGPMIMKAISFGSVIFLLIAVLGWLSLRRKKTC